MATSKEIVVTLRLEDKGAVQRLGQLELETKSFQRELKTLNAEIAKNGAATKEQTQRVGELAASIRRNQTVVRELKNDLSGATDAGLRFRDKMADAAKAGLGAFGLNILTVSGAIAGLVSVIKGAVTTLADFEKALSSVSALGGDYATRIDEISEATKTAGIAFGFTAVESVKAVEALAKAGVSVDNILSGGLEGALTLAAAGALDVATAAEAAAKAMVQFGLAGQDVTRIADLFANSANKALGEVSDITQALNQSGQVANQFGVSIEETVGTLTAFANAGLLGSDAGTSFRTMLIRLAKPTEDSAKLMEQLGINAFNAQGEFVGIEALAGQLQTQLADLTEEQRNTALATIFGTDAIRSASILYEGGAEAIAKWTAEVSESGEAARIAQEKTNNLQGDLDKLSASYDTLILGGGALSDVLRKITQGLTEQVSAAAQAETALEAITALINPLFAQTIKAQAALKDAQQSLAEDPLGILKASTAELEKRLAEINKQRADFISVGKDYEASMRDGEAAQIEAALASRALAAETAKVGAASATASTDIDTQTASTVKLTAAQIEANRVAKEAAEGRAEAVPERLETREAVIEAAPLSFTPEGVTAAEQAAQDYLRLTEEIRLLEIQGITDHNAELLALDAEYKAGLIASDEEYAARKAAITNRITENEFQQQQMMVAAAADFFGALSQLAEQGTAEFKALATAQALINTYLGATQALSQPNPLIPPFVKILQAAAIIASGLASVRKIQGFARGGIIDDGHPIRRDNGDDVLITAKRGEVILNESQQARLLRMYGSDLFKRAGVPGFATGGVAGNNNIVRFTRGTGIAPRPSPSDITATERLAEARATNFAPVVSVVEINRVQQRTAVIESLSTA